MIKDGSYSEFADQMIGEVRNGARLHGGNFSNLLFFGDGHNAARVYIEAYERFGPFVTAAAFANQCEWNNDADARQFVEENPEWPPRKIVDDLRYM
jgi:hypothetical protein